MARILILTVPHGAAHERLAQALRRALVELDPGVTVDVEDMLAHCAPWFRAYYNSYRLPLRHWPALWGWIESRQHKGAATGPGWLYRRGARPLFRFLQAEDPDVVIATEVGACELAALYKRRRGACFRLVGATAGVDVDRPWAQPEVDLYPIAPGEPAEALKRAGVPSEKILACGLPVDPRFGVVTNRDELRARLGVASELPLILVLFGGAGFGSASRIGEELRVLSAPVQTVFICGRNRRMEQEVNHLCHKLTNARAYGWVDNMHEWMAAADLVVSKPGGTTILEALNSSLPLLALNPLPGAERRSCDLIQRWGVGCWVKRHADLAPTIQRLLMNASELDRMRARARELARPRAAYEAAEAILELATDRRESVRRAY